ncbi:hypothetical protein ACFODL_15485 [Phenylobacterium terrae]|uniref:Uncharacterized protein n=1 Tax=Phenylobacterium terrae TaxID=2665495 RepID=A0ABW4N7V5_9CAUL
MVAKVEALMREFPTVGWRDGKKYLHCYIDHRTGEGRFIMGYGPDDDTILMTVVDPRENFELANQTAVPVLAEVLRMAVRR